MEKEIAQILLSANAVTLNPSNPFTFASGIKSPIYCDNRLLISNLEAREKVIAAFAKKLEGKEFDVLAGTATAGIPWCSWLAKELNKPMVYVRAKAKDHGKENLVEGKLEQGKKVIVIEDLISTGGSSVAAVEAVRQAGGVVENCVAIFTYELEKAQNKFAQANCAVETLTNFSSLVDVASDTNYIQPQEKSMVLEWKDDTQGWGEKFAS